MLAAELVSARRCYECPARTAQPPLVIHESKFIIMIWMLQASLQSLQRLQASIED
jgi:hypothetical protein